MVNDVLDYSKLEAGEIELQAADFSPREMVERVVRLSVGEVARKGLRLDLDVAGSCPPSARADVAKIQRILVNLIGNAVKFTSRGSVSVSVGASEGRLSFAVRDTGPGIPAGDQSRVFQAFVQLSAPDAPQIAGTGLGLPVCVRLAELLGAELTLECPQSGGTLFRLDCPVGKARHKFRKRRNRSRKLRRSMCFWSRTMRSTRWSSADFLRATDTGSTASLTEDGHWSGSAPAVTTSS